MSEYDDGLMEAWRRWAEKHDIQIVTPQSIAWPLHDPETSAMDLITPRRTKVRYSLWRSRQDAMREWDASLARTVLGIKEVEAWRNEHHARAQRDAYLSRVYADFEATAEVNGSRVRLTPHVWPDGDVTYSVPNGEPVSNVSLPHVPGQSVWFRGISVRKVKRMPAWIPDWLRRAIIRAVPSCTLWRPTSWSDRMVLKIWPYWVVDRMDIEELS
jgi:hypothetical protein